MSARILVIDDESVVGTVIARALGSEFSSDCCPDAATGLARAGQQAYQVIFLDIKLADRDGLEVYQDLRRLCPDSKVVLMTGYLDPAIHQKAQLLGADGFLTKPFHLQDLVEVVNRLLGPAVM